MYNKLLRLKSFLLGLVLVAFAAAPSVAQVQYADGIVSADNVSNANRAVDGSITTAAILSEPLIGGAALRVSFPAMAPKGMQAGLLIQPSSTMNLGLLSNVVVSTYKKTSTGTTEMERFQVGQLVTLDLQSSQPTMVYFTPQRDFNQLELSIGGLVNAGMDMSFFAAFGGANPLPVELTAFQGKPTAGGVALTWETASERNADHFVVERASNSPTDFQALAQVKSAGNSTQARHYQFVDATPSQLSYYRLRQVDFNGQETFSPVVAVQGEQRALTLAAYPSPATEVLTVTAAPGSQLSIFDQLGHQVRQATASLGQVQQLDVRSLPNGVYFVQNATTGERTKFVKANGLPE